jgi:hypothetical protein
MSDRYVYKPEQWKRGKMEFDKRKLLPEFIGAQLLAIGVLIKAMM